MLGEEEEEEGYLDCVSTPMTSAYRSAMMCTLLVLGPEYLSIKHIRRSKHAVPFEHIRHEPAHRSTALGAGLTPTSPIATRHGFYRGVGVAVSMPAQSYCSFTLPFICILMAWLSPASGLHLSAPPTITGGGGPR